MILALTLCAINLPIATFEYRYITDASPVSACAGADEKSLSYSGMVATWPYQSNSGQK